MKIKLYILFLLTLCLAVFGCGSDSGDQISGQQGLALQPIIVPPDPDPISNLRIVSVLPFELPPLQGGSPTGTEVRVDGAVVAANLPFIGATGYLELEPGSHTVEFRLFGELVGSRSLDIQDGQAKTLAILINDVLLGQNIPEIRAQFEDETKTIVLTDDVSPAEGQLRARLVNGLRFESEANLLTFERVPLLGPVREGGQVGPYQSLNLPALQITRSLIAMFQEVGGSDTDIAEFETLVGGDQSIIETLGAQVGTTGVNLTAFLEFLPFSKEIVLFIVRDDINSGDTTIQSLSEGFF